MHQSNKSLIIDKKPREEEIIKNTKNVCAHTHTHTREIVCCCGRSGGVVSCQSEERSSPYFFFHFQLLKNGFPTLSSSGHWLVLMMNRSSSTRVYSFTFFVWTFQVTFLSCFKKKTSWYNYWQAGQAVCLLDDEIFTLRDRERKKGNRTTLAC